MKWYQAYQTENDCYKKAEKIMPVGVLWHSTGATNPYLRRYVDAEAFLGKNPYGNHWNKPGIKKMVHAFIGLDIDENIAVVQTLPYEYASWGVGTGSKGSYNYSPTAYIQFEICEAALTDKEYFNLAMSAAVEYTAKLCREYGWTEKNVTSHVEAARSGYGSNHADPEHWMKKFSVTMDDMRVRIKAALAASTPFLPSDVGIEPKAEIRIGDRVNFMGNKHYSNAAAKTGKATSPGLAIVSAVAKGKAHPYHIKAINGVGTYINGVNGWVNAVDIGLFADAGHDASGENNRLYTVKKGDTLWSISKEHLGAGVRYREIINLNNIKDGLINIGQKLYLPK